MHSKFNSTTSFIDVLFNTLISLSALFLLTILIINPNKHEESSRKEQAPYIFVIKWQDNSNHDVDLWLTNGEETCMFDNRQTRSMSLDRDDLGPDNVLTMEHFIKENEEILSIRSLRPAVYTAAAHFYRERSESPEKPIIRWALIKTTPHNTVVASGTAYLTSQGQEVTLIRFRIDESGNVVNKDTSSQYPFTNKR